jgi:hypothetical protein
MSGLGWATRLRLAAGDLAAQPLRTFLAIVVLAPLAASWFVLAATAAALREAPATEGERVLYVTDPDLFDPGSSWLDPGVLDQAAEIAGADALLVAPVVVRVVEVDGRTVQLRAAEPSVWNPAFGLELQEGREPAAGADELAITASVRSATGWQPGDVIPVFGTDFTITGVYRSSGLSVASLWMRLERAERLYERPGEFQFVAVRLAEGADAEAVRARLQAAFPDLIAVEQSAVQIETSRLRRSLGDVGRASIAIGFIGLLAGAATTTALTVAERSRSIGLLRMLGLSPAQLQGLLATRAVLTAAGAVVIGLAIAVPLVATRDVIVLYTYPVRPTVPLWAVAAGIALSLLSAWAGAVLATRRALRSPVRVFLDG